MPLPGEAMRPHLSASSFVCVLLIHEPDDGNSDGTSPSFGGSTPHDARAWGGVGFWHLRGEPPGGKENHPIFQRPARALLKAIHTIRQPE
ncbi:hypothetical protein SETIT_9G144400v2 [Setaria italica]|uniref:Uncharacterized protein n=2 Tax=Setaria TaxID=4554 RepID=K4AH96_SETIT|nr:hypothetical protein SETIT_9G144400v2 [Setaria italica]TKV92119.1 hypothetical protein SEVIR_9G142600v2 [Setaria viridis]